MAVLNPDKVIFNKKYLLLKSTDPMIEMPESDYLLIKQLEEGLTDKEQSRLNELNKLYPALNQDFVAYKQAKLQPQHFIFHKQAALFRKNYRRIWTAIGSFAAAAAVLLLIQILPQPSYIGEKPHKTYPNEDNLTLLDKEAPNKTPSKEENIAFLDKETSPPIPVKERNLVLLEELRAAKINVYEVGLILMIPQYLENMQLIQTYNVAKHEHEYEYEQKTERSSIIKASERLINRIFFRNIVFEMEPYFAFNTDFYVGD